MTQDQEPHNLEELLDRCDAAAQASDPVSLRILLQETGRRSFGPLLLVAGMVTLAPPIGAIPGVPTMIAVVVFLVAIQLLLGAKHFWLPAWLLNRSVPSDKLCKALNWLRRPARFIDRLLRARLTILANGPATWAIAAACLLISAAMPVTELVPFSAVVAGGALAAFGLALMARDGLLSLTAFLLTFATVGVLAMNLA